MQEKSIFELHLHSQNEFGTPKADEQEGKVEDNFEVDENLKNELMKKINWEYPNLAITTIPGKSSVTALKGQEADKTQEGELTCVLDVPEFLEPEKELTGAQKGTAMHLALQKLDLKKNYTTKELQDFVYMLEAKKILTEKEAESISIQKIETFLKSNLAKEIAGAKKIYKEKPFYIYIPAFEIYEIETDKKIVVQGIIDLYFKDKDDNLILVDYKTDYVPENNENYLKDKYKMQIEIYKRALEQGTGKKVHKSYIYSLYLGKEIKM